MSPLPVQPFRLISPLKCETTGRETQFAASRWVERRDDQGFVYHYQDTCDECRHEHLGYLRLAGRAF